MRFFLLFPVLKSSVTCSSLDFLQFSKKVQNEIIKIEFYYFFQNFKPGRTRNVNLQSTLSTPNVMNIGNTLKKIHTNSASNL